MRRLKKALKVMTCLIAVTFCCLSIVVAPVHASLVGTADILNSRENADARQKVMRFLEREDVAQHLHTLGVAEQEARSRVEAMTAEELNLLSHHIDQMPAGGDALGFIVGVAFVAFVTLIITDIIGITDIFTFIKKR
jgi:hypothetical protein